ncbi:hypothetical protein HYQ45_000949 [Verticillium longisporum]|uniref:Uncharacterized protein n=1 Tax=Verticillium longisporum TaxID=100787 RepID=A0A8I3AX10_VERLO|nr:hypothetical protein HYQ45_000949 [Verticillium longisporum]
MVIDHAKTHPELFRGWACFPDDVEIYVYLDGTRHVEMSDMLEKPPAGRGIVPPDYVCPFVLIPNNEDWEDLQKRTITRQLLNAVREAGFLASFESCLAVLAGPQVDWAAVEDQRNLEEPLDSGVVDTTPSVTVSPGPYGHSIFDPTSPITNESGMVNTTSPVTDDYGKVENTAFEAGGHDMVDTASPDRSGYRATTSMLNQYIDSCRVQVSNTPDPSSSSPLSSPQP